MVDFPFYLFFFNITFFQKFLKDFLYPLRCEIQKAFRPHKTAFLGFILIFFSFLSWAHCDTCLKGNYIFILFYWFGCNSLSRTVPLRVFTFFPGSTGILPIRRLWSRKTIRQVIKLTFSPLFLSWKGRIGFNNNKMNSKQFNSSYCVDYDIIKDVCYLDSVGICLPSGRLQQFQTLGIQESP